MPFGAMAGMNNVPVWSRKVANVRRLVLNTANRIDNDAKSLTQVMRPSEKVHTKNSKSTQCVCDNVTQASTCFHIFPDLW